MYASSSVFCSTCWPEQVEAGARAYEVFKDDRDDADDNFWIVDNCAGCGSEVKYVMSLATRAQATQVVAACKSGRNILTVIMFDRLSVRYS